MVTINYHPIAMVVSSFSSTVDLNKCKYKAKPTHLCWTLARELDLLNKS